MFYFTVYYPIRFVNQIHFLITTSFLKDIFDFGSEVQVTWIIYLS